MRTLNRVLAGALALALFLGGLLAVAEIVVGALGNDPWIVPYDSWYRQAQQEPWSSGEARIVFLVALVTGLVLLALQVTRWRPVVLPLQRRARGDSADIRRSSLERALVRQARSIDGVASASVRIVGSKIKVRANSTRRQPGDLRQRLISALDAQLQALGLARRPGLDVSVRPRR